MSRTLRQLRVVAANELVDSVRSRRALVLLFLYLAGSAVACVLFIHILHKLEVRLVESMGLTASSEPGGATRTLWQSSHFRHMMGELVGDSKLAMRLLDLPPLSIYYGWLAFTFTPLLVMLISAPRIAEEVSTASVRFVLFRTSRATWCGGKLLGQAGLLLVALLASAVGAWVVGAFRMASFEFGANAAVMFVFALKAWVYALAYLGLALGVSQLTRSPVIATGLGLAAMLGLSIVNWTSDYWHGEGWFRILDITRMLTPGGNNLHLWNPDPAYLVPTLVFLPALGLLYFLAGYAFFARRDQ
jgi:ABC-type transport system involved in multi-copper enzyme maturation permease subunit